MLRPIIVATSVVLILAALVVAGTVAIGSENSGPAEMAFGTGRDGIWIDVVWTAQPRSRSEIAGLVRSLESRNFRYVYVYVNSLEPGGLPKESTHAYATHFMSTARRVNPNLKLIAWIGIVNVRDGQGKVDISQPEVRANIAAFCGRATREFGFDGVQLDVEPLPSGDESFLALLDLVRNEIGPSKILSIASHKWRPDFRLFEVLDTSYWDSAYYAQVATRVDQMAVMGYDTYMASAFLYRTFLKYQVVNITRAVSETNVDILMGIPTYEEPRLNHNPQVENVENALKGTIAGLLDARTDRSRFAGVAVYAHWETDEAEWAIYDYLWLGRRQR